MKIVKLNSMLLLVVLAILDGCGGKTINSTKDVNQVETERFEEIKNIEQQIIGYWKSANPTNPEYEFYASGAEFDSELKSGKVFVGGKLVNLFYWSLQRDGAINLTLIDSLCNSRPLNTCSTKAIVKIQASGGSILSATWNVRYENASEIYIRSFVSQYSRKNIDLSELGQGEFFLSEHEVFDFPIAGKVDGNTISIFIDNNRQIKFSASLNASIDTSVKFDAGKDLAYYDSVEFFIDGIGYRNLQVKQWYEDVVLSASEGNKYVLRYELHREIQSPSNIDPALVHLGSYRLLMPTSKSYTLVSGFINGPRIKAMDKFFSLFSADLGNNARTFNGSAGELLFVSNGEAVASLNDNVDGLKTNTAKQTYDWSQNDDGTIFLKSQLSGVKNITVRFIKAISGGYNVLYSYSDGSYQRHDLILDAASVVEENTFAGRYKFISNNGFSDIEIIFHKDKTVTSIPSVVNGHWFQDSNGDIISFECTTLARVDITNYAECYADFDRLSDMAFVHIRRLGFIHRDGSNFQMRYAASFYGDVFNTTSVSKDYLSLAWTYRWSRVGDVN